MTESKNILIGTTNPFKADKLAAIVAGLFEPQRPSGLPEVEESGATFREIAENKAIAYSLAFGGLAIASDGGASFPALKDWDPLRTRRFIVGNDEERITALLDRLAGEANRTVEWREAIALAENGKLIFSAEARAMDGVISQAFDPSKYRAGAWLCSITDFPQFGGRNYFDLDPAERAATEDSWSKLEQAFREFINSTKTT